jgi:tetratricopeptide (TPR) repeat protein
MATSLAVLTPSVAMATDNDSEVVRQLADVSFQSGVHWFKKADYQRALVEFSKANAVYPRGSTMRNIGLCQLKLGRPLEAMRFFRAAIKAPDTKPEQRDLAKQDMADAYAQTGHILIHANDGASTLTVDGQEAGQALQDPVDVAPGHHLVEARFGAQTVRVEVDAPAGTTVTADVKVPDPSAPVGPPPVAPTATQPAPVEPQAPLSERPGFWSIRRGVGLGVAIFGAAALVGGEIFQSQAQNEKNSAAQIRNGQPLSACSGAQVAASCASLTAAQDAQQRDATWSVVSWVTGGVGLAAGAALLLWPQSQSQSSQATIRAAVEPFSMPHGSGLQLRGEF